MLRELDELQAVDLTAADGIDQSGQGDPPRHGPGEPVRHERQGRSRRARMPAPCSSTAADHAGRRIPAAAPRSTAIPVRRRSATPSIDRMLFRGRAGETDEVLHSILSYDLFLVYAVSGHGQDVAAHGRGARTAAAAWLLPRDLCASTAPTRDRWRLIEQQIRAGRRRGPGRRGRSTPPPRAAAGARRRRCGICSPSSRSGAATRSSSWSSSSTSSRSCSPRHGAPTTAPASSSSSARSSVATACRGRDVDPRTPRLPPPNVKVVLFMREDFIGQLEELAVSVPQIMHRRFRLGALTPEQAQAAICEPAALDDPRLRTQRFSYSAGAASTILTFLRTKDERGKAVLTPRIDPSQLQIICQHVERSILPRKAAAATAWSRSRRPISADRRGCAESSATSTAVCSRTFPAEERKAIRHLCETGLISQTGRRLSQEEGEIYDAHFDVTRTTLAQAGRPAPPAIGAARRQRLLRARPRHAHRSDLGVPRRSTEGATASTRHCRRRRGGPCTPGSRPHVRPRK